MDFSIYPSGGGCQYLLWQGNSDFSSTLAVQMSITVSVCTNDWFYLIDVCIIQGGFVYVLHELLVKKLKFCFIFVKFIVYS